MRNLSSSGRQLCFGIGLLLLLAQLVVQRPGLAENGEAKTGGETLLQVSGGEAGVLSYGLYVTSSTSRASSNASPGANLILALRNTGAKSINMEHVSVSDFSLEDATGKQVRIYLWTRPRTIGYGDLALVQIGVERPTEAPQPWTLRFKSAPGAFVPFDLLIKAFKLPMKAGASGL